MSESGDRLTPARAIFVLLSFEGPDRYAIAGGLGVRVAELSRALASAGYETHLIFVGDPAAPATETALGGRLTLHRWSQWISRYYPGGVYQGEEAKLYDFVDSAPPFVVERLARPAIEAGRLVVVMAEEWHTAEALCRVSDLLHEAGLRSRAVLVWNANHTMGFHRINWGRLGYVSALTTVSRYMKHLMWRHGVNPLVIPNGIPARLLEPADPGEVARLRRALGRSLVLTKVGRWDPDKRWLMAVEALAQLKARGGDAVLVALGGVEPHQGEVLHRARTLGLAVRDVAPAAPTLDACAEAFRAAAGADLLNVRSFVPLPLLRVLYRASSAVLANSGHEPFGLVALEAMASGAVAITGATGEDYAVHMENAVVLETDDPGELAWYVQHLDADPALAARLGAAGVRTARRFVWDRVVRLLLDRIEFLAGRQGMLSAPWLRAAPVEGRPAAVGVSGRDDRVA